MELSENTPVGVHPDLATAKSIFIGTSGWHYKYWRGTFYPERLPLHPRCSAFTASTSTRWSGTLRFTACRLRDPDLALDRFFERIHSLGRKLSPFVFQLPPQWPRTQTDCASFWMRCRAAATPSSFEMKPGTRLRLSYFGPAATRLSVFSI